MLPRRSSAKRPLPLEPLAYRRTRLKLLLSSYLDAATAADEQGEQELTSGSEPGSREPRRNEELWRAGSYKELELCMDRLKDTRGQAYRELWHVYVRGYAPADLEAEVWAKYGLWLLEEWMPPWVFVPLELSENAGYLEAEAKTYHRGKA